jgi:hypothetical protein
VEFWTFSVKELRLGHDLFFLLFLAKLNVVVDIQLEEHVVELAFRALTIEGASHYFRGVFLSFRFLQS